MTRPSLLLTLLAATLAALPALAAKPTVAVLPLSPAGGALPDSAGETLGATLSEELASRVRLVALRDPEADAALRAKSEEPTKVAAAATAAVARLAASAAGGRAVKKGGESAEAVLALALVAVAATQELTGLVAALGDLAAAHDRAGRPEAARTALERLFVLDPNHPLDDPAFAGPLATAAADVRAALAGGSRGRLAVGSSPAGLAVSLDGRALGEAPLVATDLLPGDHLVLVRGPGGAAVSGVVRVEADATGAFDAELVPKTAPTALARAALARNDLDAPFTDAVRRLGAASEASYVVVGAYAPAKAGVELRLVLVRASDGARLALTPAVTGEAMLDAGLVLFKVADEVEQRLGAGPKFSPAEAGPLFAATPAPRATAEVPVSPPAARPAGEARGADTRSAGPLVGAVSPEEQARLAAADEARSTRNLWLGVGGGAVAVGAAVVGIWLYRRPVPATRASFQVEWAP